MEDDVVVVGVAGKKKRGRVLRSPCLFHEEFLLCPLVEEICRYLLSFLLRKCDVVCRAVT